MTRRFATLALILGLVALPAAAIEVEVVIENISPQGGTLMTPVWIGFHDGTFDTYDPGVSADGFPGLERLAEDGNAGPLSDNFALLTPLGEQGVATGPSGPIAPGERAILRFDLDPESGNHTYFSYASMIIPSNDAFVSNGNPLAHRVFDTDGNLTPFHFFIVGNEVNDAGTEVNDEIPANTAALAQSAPDTGVDENGVITSHPGFMPGGNVLDAIPNGQFADPGYRIARVSVRPVRVDRVRFSGDGSQEVPAANTDASVACTASLNSARTEMTVRCEHDVENVVAAHVHEAPPGVSGGIVFPFDSPFSPIEQTFAVTPQEIATFFAGGYYVNVHSDDFPNGEVRAQIDGCFEGPSSLCLNQGRFQVDVNFATPQGLNGQGQAVPESDDSGLFTFFDEDNLELLIKVLNGCGFNDHYWVFVSGLTNVQVGIRVEDTHTGEDVTVFNPQGQEFEPSLDVTAFDTCP